MYSSNIGIKTNGIHVIVIFFLLHVGFVIGHALNQEGEETLPMLETTNKGATNRMEQYNNFLRSLANSMTANVFKRIKCFVRGKNLFIPNTDILTNSFKIINKCIFI